MHSPEEAPERAALANLKIQFFMMIVKTYLPEEVEETVPDLVSPTT